jgi:hypothetical protein
LASRPFSGFLSETRKEAAPGKFRASCPFYLSIVGEGSSGIPDERAGEPMERYFEDYQKQRLTERFDILAAISILKSQGYEDDELIKEIIRVFYVDLDTYNEVVGQAA